MDKRGFKSQERKTYYSHAFDSIPESWSSDGVGRFVTWFILWITCQNVPVDRWELVTGVVSFSMLRSKTSFTLNIIMIGLSNSFFGNITLSFTFPHLKIRSHHCWLDLFILDVLLGKECYAYAALHDGFDQSSPQAFSMAYFLVRASLGKGGLVLGDVTARGRVQV